ncbi:hypothetical protein [Haloarcula sp. 1CSR25-25]|uniref:hypothetical protein n=1 Tax=Haloarcula sp. 1CSR25-25 TaxID=2862545 RepID=UPI002894E172|nr:hypothetical protein [Haloarcula sp. 1CSR25-25]MDT3437134.1 hypothetical protein [Haloarcula sp. 1CSR25-25]
MREPTTPVGRVSAGLQYHRGRQQGTVDRGVTDLRNSKIWELPFIVDGDLSDILDTDPWEVVVQVPMTIEVHLDDTVSVDAVTERL